MDDRLERLLEDVEAIPDERARERALAALRGVVELYGAGLERVVEILAAREDAAELADALAADELVSHLLLLHDLHPVPVETRVRSALDEVRPYLDSHGGGVELLSVEDRVVRLRLEGSCNGCPSSTATLKLAIEDAVRKAAPDVEAVEADGVDVAPLLQIEVRKPDWVAVDGVGSLADGTTALRHVDSGDVLFVRLGDELYAYRPECACGASLADVDVADGCVTCPACDTRYDVRHAGRSAGERQLRPVPLLERDGGVRVAA